MGGNAHPPPRWSFPPIVTGPGGRENADVTARIFTEQRADVGLVRVVGEIDLATSPLLLRTLVRMVEASHAVEVDLRRVTFIDVTGLRAVRQGERAAWGSGCHFVVRRSGVVQRLERLVDELLAARV